MIRFSVVKVGERLGGRRNQRGKIEETARGGESDWVGVGGLVRSEEVLRGMSVGGNGSGRGLAGGSPGEIAGSGLVESRPISELD